MLLSLKNKVLYLKTLHTIQQLYASKTKPYTFFNKNIFYKQNTYSTIRQDTSMEKMLPFLQNFLTIAQTSTR